MRSTNERHLRLGGTNWPKKLIGYRVPLRRYICANAWHTNLPFAETIMVCFLSSNKSVFTKRPPTRIIPETSKNEFKASNFATTREQLVFG